MCRAVSYTPSSDFMGMEPCKPVTTYYIIFLCMGIDQIARCVCSVGTVACGEVCRYSTKDAWLVELELLLDTGHYTSYRRFESL